MTILTSDHGDYLCDFNLLLKAALPFRAIAQMPMIWPDPADRSPLRTNALASTIDITVCILERSGLAPYHGIRDRSSLSGFGGGTDHPDALLKEHNDAGPRIGLDTAARVRSLVTRNW